MDEDEQVKLSPFYKLLRMGLIDHVGGNTYRLTASRIICSPQYKYSIGVNLPAYIIDENKKWIHRQYLGLVIFNKNHWPGLEELIREFNLENYSTHLQPLNKIIKNWHSIDAHICNEYISLEVLNTVTNKWVRATKYDSANALYKRYIYQDAYFEYILVHANKYYCIKPYETDKTLYIRLYLSKHPAFEYENRSQLLSIKKGYIIPNYIYKTLFATHILNKGELPRKNQFFLTRTQVRKILKPLNILYTII